MSTPHVLYRVFDESGELLYVGITMNPPSRLSAHRATKDWWAGVAHISLQRFDSREAACAAEREAVRNEKPVLNVVRFKGQRRRLQPPMVKFEAACRGLGWTPEQLMEFLESRRGAA